MAVNIENIFDKYVVKWVMEIFVRKKKLDHIIAKDERELKLKIAEIERKSQGILDKNFNDGKLYITLEVLDSADGGITESIDNITLIIYPTYVEKKK